MGFDDPRELERHIRFMKSKNRRGANLLKRTTELRRLSQRETARPTGLEFSLGVILHGFRRLPRGASL